MTVYIGSGSKPDPLQLKIDAAVNEYNARIRGELTGETEPEPEPVPEPPAAKRIYRRRQSR